MDANGTSYQPVIALIAMTALMAMAASLVASGSIVTVMAAGWFITCDLLALHRLPYAKLYPFKAGAAGVLMIAAALNFSSIPGAFFIGELVQSLSSRRFFWANASCAVPVSAAVPTSRLVCLTHRKRDEGGHGTWMIVK